MPMLSFLNAGSSKHTKALSKRIFTIQLLYFSRIVRTLCPCLLSASPCACVIFITKFSSYTIAKLHTFEERQRTDLQAHHASSMDAFSASRSVTSARAVVPPLLLFLTSLDGTTLFCNSLWTCFPHLTTHRLPSTVICNLWNTCTV